MPELLLKSSDVLWYPLFPHLFHTKIKPFVQIGTLKQAKNTVKMTEELLEAQAVLWVTSGKPIQRLATDDREVKSYG